MLVLLPIAFRRRHHCVLALRAAGAADPARRRRGTQRARTRSSPGSSRASRRSCSPPRGCWACSGRRAVPAPDRRRAALVLALTLLVPRLGELVERPFRVLTRRARRRSAAASCSAPPRARLRAVRRAGARGARRRRRRATASAAGRPRHARVRPRRGAADAADRARAAGRRRDGFRGTRAGGAGRAAAC